MSIRCRLYGHDFVKLVLAVGRKRHFYECRHCGEVVHRPPEADDG